MRVLVTGSRHGHRLVERWLDAWVDKHGVPELFVLGDALGVDEQARRHCAVRVGWQYERTFADWSAGKSGGPARNARMVAKCMPGDVCLAFPSAASRGTHDCAGKARARGLAVHTAP